MANALTLEDMSPGLAKGVERAQREPAGRFHALAHLIDVPPSHAPTALSVRTRRARGSPLEQEAARAHRRAWLPETPRAMNARGPGRVTATLREWEMACGGAQWWDADETKKWVLAAPHGRSIMAAE